MPRLLNGERPVRVLCVDDDPTVLQIVCQALEGQGLLAAPASSAAQALSWIERNGLPHLAIVDIRMPGTSGIELCTEVQQYSDLPVILLSALDDEKTMVQSIETIAEDYVTKPFRPAELVARAKRVLRRMGEQSIAEGPRSTIDDRLVIDVPHQLAEIDGETVTLTPTESKILHILLRRIGRTVRSGYLLRRLWPEKDVFEDALRVHISRLRQKLEPDPSNPRYLLTDRGHGYRLAGEADRKMPGRGAS